MRLNPDTTANLLSYLTNARLAEETALRELSSGRRASLPSDDPSAVAAVLSDHARMSRDDQFIESVATVRDMLSVADSSLSSVVTALQRAITLGVQGGTGTISAANRKAIAADVAGISDQILGIANMSYRGSFIFAGTAATKPYVEDSTGVHYVGNNVTNGVMVTESLTVKTNTPGSTIFSSASANVFNSLAQLKAGLESDDAEAIQQATSSIRNAFDQVTSARAAYGNTIQQLDACRQFLDAEQLNLKTRENSLVGADPIKAASDLAEAQFAREATLQAVGRQSRLSLLDYLR